MYHSLDTILYCLCKRLSRGLHLPSTHDGLNLSGHPLHLAVHTRAQPESVLLLDGGGGVSAAARRLAFYCKIISAILKKKKKKRMDTTPRGSRVVPHPSTKRAQPGLTSEFGRDRVYYRWCGRIHWWPEKMLTCSQYC